LPAAESLVVPAEARGQRLDRWLAALPDAPTRSQVALAIAAGHVTLDGAAAKASYRLRGGEAVRIEMPEKRAPVGIVAQAIALDVLYADEVMVAINKAPGMVVHPAAGNRAGTLVHALLHRFPLHALPGAPERAGIVHRLDRDTSGVILVALDVRAHEALAKQFRNRTIEKQYLALVRGDVRKAGEIDAPIGRHPHDRKRMSTSARRARSASTAYRVEESFGAATLLRVEPHTGRTHQIRVHLASRGWPIVGDSVYGALSDRALAAARRRWGERARLLETLPRQALHAHRIRFAHPMSGRPMEIDAPLAEDMAELVRALRTHVPRTANAVDSRGQID
jgi:23S rRNA pseudouridine1911/1915/1917 synthase